METDLCILIHISDQCKFFKMFFSCLFGKRLTTVKESNASSANRLPWKALEGSTEGPAQARIEEICHLFKMVFFQEEGMCLPKPNLSNLYRQRSPWPFYTFTFLSVFRK